MLRFPVHLRAPMHTASLQAVERLPVWASACRTAYSGAQARKHSTVAVHVDPPVGTGPPSGLFPRKQADPGDEQPSVSSDVNGATGAAVNGIAAFEAQLQELAVQPASAISLTNLFRVGLNPTPDQSLLNAQFLWRELRIRFAHRALQLRSLPFGLSDHRCVKQATDKYTQMTAILLTCAKPRTLEDEENFARILHDTKPSSLAIPHKIGVALAELRRSAPLSPAQQRVVDQRLDAFFLSRIGHRFLIQHYLASKRPREGFSGIIQSRCSPVEVCEHAAAHVVAEMRASLGTCPEVDVIGDEEKTFTYLPSHIFFIVSELLKNACSATVRHHRGVNECLPPVRVIVAHGGEDVTIKVEDQGGGIARSQLADVWSYTGKWSSDVQDGFDPQPSPTVGGDAAPPARHGLGLPLSRLYAKYFGGTLHVTPMEGYGTDCYVKLNRLGDHNCENLPSIVASSPGELDSCAKPSQGLYDAQARR